MLIEFRVENHRSIREEQVLTFEAAPIGDEEDARPRKVEGHSKPLLPAIALYGANASGKSNVLMALEFMQGAVVASFRFWEPNAGVPRDAFGWGEWRSKPSMYEVVVLIAGVRYEYGFVVDDSHFLEEWLYAYPNGRKQTWFEREEQQFLFGDNLRGENRVVETVTRPNALFLSAAAQLGHQQLSPIFGWFQKVHSLRVIQAIKANRAAWQVSSTVLQLQDQARRLNSLENAHVGARLVKLFEMADVGIVDVRVEEHSDEASKQQLWLRHSATDDKSWLPLESESLGTQTLVNLSPFLVDVLEIGGVWLVDELEANLHPLLAMKLVGLFNNPATNPRSAQVLFTTHDTNLLGNDLGEPPLRRDQTWLTEKDKEGATRLYPLTDYKPRKSENLERGYLQGRYGAIPFLGTLPTERS